MRPNNKALIVQPVSIAYVGLDGAPIGINERTVLAWYGEMSLVAHIWGVLVAGRAKVVLIFHDPINCDKIESRKEIALKCENIVSRGLSDSFAGKFPK